MDDARLKEIKKRMETATTGPKIVSFKRCDEGRGIIIKDTSADMGIADRGFYANAPADIRDLLEEVERLRSLALRQHRMIGLAVKGGILWSKDDDTATLLDDGRKLLGVK